MGQSKSLTWLRNQTRHLNLDEGVSFTGALRHVYPAERVENRYRRYFQAFFQVDGDMVRQRLRSGEASSAIGRQCFSPATGRTPTRSSTARSGACPTCPLI